MSYGLRLKEILDKCELSEEERVKFEDFMDGKYLKNKEAYPNFEESLRQAIEKDPILNAAYKKIRFFKQWANITELAWKYNLK